MTIDTATAAILLTMAIQTIGLTIWLARLGARVEHLERWRDEHSDIRKDVATLGQALHDLKGWMQRIDGRLDTLAHVTRPAE